MSKLDNGKKTNNSRASDGFDIKGFVINLIAAYLGGAAGTLQQWARVPFFPDPMFGAVLGDILKDIFNAILGGSSNVISALGLSPSVLAPLKNVISNLGTFIISFFFDVKLPFLRMTLFEFTLNIVLSGWADAFLDPIIDPIASRIAGMVESVIHNALKSNFVSILLPDDVQLFTATIRGNSYFNNDIFPLPRLRTGGTCDCRATIE